MIEMSGNIQKSEIFTILLTSPMVAGIILDKVFVSTQPNVYLINGELDELDLEILYDFIKNQLTNFRFIVVYTNFYKKDAMPIIDFLRSKERVLDLQFILMYRNN